MSNLNLNYKKILIAAGTLASVAFLLTMLFWTDDIRSAEAVSAALAFEKVQAQAKDESVDGLFGNSLSGKVTVNGTAPLPQGTVVVYGPDSVRPIGFGTIQHDGHYVIPKLPIGDIRLIVTTKKTFNQGGKTNQTGRPPRKLDRPQFRLPTSVPSDHSSARMSKQTAPSDNGGLSDRESKAYGLKAEKFALHLLKQEGMGTPSLIYAKIDRLYGDLGAPKSIATKVFEGQNSFDIELDIHDDVEMAPTRIKKTGH